MKRLLLFLFLLQGITFVTFAQTNNSTAKPLSFGEKISPEGAMSTQALVTQMADKDAMPAKVQGEVISVCQAKGCWATVKLPDGKTMRVTFKDYAFFIPKDANGKTIVMEGKAFVKTETVAKLRHYAEDANASKEEIAKITEPERSLAFEAKGVLLK
ncbi:MAG: DUF4920 domain-containing protein [Bacteroidota bacterium]